MLYEDLRQWRNICECLDCQWYKFLDTDHISTKGFTLLLPDAKSTRQQLWSDYMIQLAQWGRHPHANYHHRSEYRLRNGWRLLPGWEFKIDFLEQIVLFDRKPDDLDQTWRLAIGEPFFKRHEAIVQRELEQTLWLLKQQEDAALRLQLQQARQQNLEKFTLK